ncbi:hypothetical protein CDA63_11940 [Hymenobacter amundsenii]|uniref:Uncharacterized protein n=1 Tax=Hymenobacter amundsenii TaxID=2006685 RepID=A0A246FK38_9BACT|nr:hypothetical protein [Hymenobacter amundsenii]OWP62922.1 hypothetical protein CDA63_11940 [Hymenobacter amundsenii]
MLLSVLLGSTSAWAQDDAKASATVTPTSLPGEEELPAQERAERDFLMPTRRKRAATLEAAEEAARKAEAQVQAEIALTARAAAAAEAAATPEPVAAPVEKRKVVIKRRSARR